MVFYQFPHLVWTESQRGDGEIEGEGERNLGVIVTPLSNQLEEQGDFSHLLLLLLSCLVSSLSPLLEKPMES